MKEEIDIRNESNIETLEKTVQEINKQLDIKTVIKGFSMYMSKTNSNYLYTETYLVDHIELFLKFLENYTKKNECVEGLYNNIKKSSLRPINCTIEIDIDNIWKIVFEDNDGITDWKKKLSKRCELRNIGEQYIYVKITMYTNNMIIEDFKKYDISESELMFDYILEKMKNWYKKTNQNNGNENG